MRSLSPRSGFAPRRRYAVAWFANLVPILGGLLLVIAGCADGGKDPVSPSISLSGIVRDSAAGTPLSGATVSALGQRSTTGADGRYQIADVPISSTITIGVSAPGFDDYSRTVTVQAGQNTHDVALARTTMWADASRLIYLTPGIASYRGVIFDMPGSTNDSRPLIRGNLDFYKDFPLSGDVAEYRRRLMQFAQEQQLAVMGTVTFNLNDNLPATYDAILAALTSFATRTGHPELATAPLLLYGHSLGGCIAYGFTRLRSERVIGFISGKGGCHPEVGSAGASSVPGYFFIGEEDSPAGAANITAVFGAGRAEGAPWSVAIERNAGHERLKNLDLVFNWMTTVLARRLPVGTAQPVPVDQASGWLANRSTGAIAGFGCYAGDKTLAGWLPSEQTARDWQAEVAIGNAVTSC